MLDALLHFLRSVPPWIAVAAAFLIPAAETALVLGLFLPGELAVVAAGILAARTNVPVALVVVAAVAGAILGDSIGYFVGQRYAGAISRRLTAARWKRARAWLKRRGGPAILLARFTAFVRSVMPAVAGAARFPYRKFLAWSSIAGVGWGTGSVLLGYLAGRNAERILRWTSVLGMVILLVAIGLGTLLARRTWRRRRAARRSARRAAARGATAPSSARP
jgi:membrane-associated protein